MRGYYGNSGEVGGAGQNLTLYVFQTLSRDLSFSLGYGSWRVSHGLLLESPGHFLDGTL